MFQEAVIEVRGAVDPPGRIVPLERLRELAWNSAAAGRYREALALQRALLAGASSVALRPQLRDGFRLLRWELAQGAWREADELIPLVDAGLRALSPADASLFGWLALAQFLVRFQLGQGTAARSILARAVRAARRGRSRALRRCALRLAWIQAQLAQAPGAGAHAFACMGPASPFRPPGVLSCCDAAPGPSAAAASAALAGLVKRTGRGPLLGDGAFSWDHLPALVEGPPETSGWRSTQDRLRWNAEESAAAGSGGSRIGPWLDRLEERPSPPWPAWMVSIAAGLIEEEVPELPPAERDRCHRALTLLADRVREPWARAAVLEALAETSLWLVRGREEEVTTGCAPEQTLARARHDLALAAGLHGCMGWKERAAHCERLWARLSWPAMGPALSAAESKGAPRYRPARPNLNAIRHSLAEHGFVTGDTRLLRELAPLVLLAAAPLPVLILGESGTGKEVIARALHRWSQLQGEFVPIHCGAIPRDLLESELFGHTRGAFTGAAADKAGLVEVAHGGSLFLDEIGEMGKEAQMKMLRVLESGEVRRLGDLRPRRAQLRLVAATHRDLDEAVKLKSFRLDLYHRIRGITVTLRPLRERRGDIPLLAGHLLAAAAGAGPPLRLPETALACLLGHDWPGNVRELRSVLLRAAHLCRALGLNAIPPEFLELGPPGGAASRESAALAEWVCDSAPGAEGWVSGLPTKEMLAHAGLEAVLEDVERRLILSALEENGWNRTRAAKTLGNLSRTTLLSKMKRLGIHGGAAEAASPEEGVEGGASVARGF